MIGPQVISKEQWIPLKKHLLILKGFTRALRQ